MSRSVSYLNNSEFIIYFDNYSIEEEFEWSDFEEDIKYQLKQIAPSLEGLKEVWDSNEVKIIMENGFCEIGISDYCGLSSVSIRVHQNIEEQSLINLAINWIYKILPKFKNLSKLRKLGTFSNGEGVYERKGA